MSDVLIVDDFSTVRAIIRRALAGLHVYDVTEACNGIEAVKAMQTQRYSLLITDWNMPEMSGLELAEEARRLDPRIEVLMVTSNGTRENVLEAASVGVTNDVVKPFSRFEFQRRARALLKLPAMRGDAPHAS